MAAAAARQARSILCSHRETVAAPPSLAWKMLLEKIRRPDLYVPGVKSVEVVKEFSANSIERKMMAGDKLIHEIIGADEATLTVVFRMHQSHPILSGFVTNTVLPLEAEVGGGLPEGEKEATACVLDYTMCWEAKPGAPEAAVKEMQEMLPNSCVNAVVHAKEMMEKAAKENAQ
mmetsp:Transcript_3247/g.7211  ORF Transcript_3247/g.7211 Transcript_3247/m.7211 type:complete len:174 (-) Transcript_3247:137-658(-)|eukprot:CAMPEP_0178423994 /NCGR_PEP_ID=MMETSP0689_2-20121128/27980_1 /TAXON_ID=160604 /ORGANISM="Amphidinium massartii, Strain CS-259" /LENGTH=173 /DNA_ID=CAMNT_0020045615 /DNA_START=84 /DNA_END=605 /DNA_ORIENTATION=+